MNTLLATLAQRDPAPFDSIVHIGCGPYAGLEDYAPLESKHLLLVEADPEAFAELAERHAGSESVTLVQALVRGGVGEAAFHRYSLPMLNSPLGIGRLREIYPRVELLETLPMQATALAALLSERAPALGLERVAFDAECRVLGLERLVSIGLLMDFGGLRRKHGGPFLQLGF